MSGYRALLPNEAARPGAMRILYLLEQGPKASFELRDEATRGAHSHHSVLTILSRGGLVAKTNPHTRSSLYRLTPRGEAVVELLHALDATLRAPQDAWNAQAAERARA